MNSDECNWNPAYMYHYGISAIRIYFFNTEDMVSYLRIKTTLNFQAGFTVYCLGPLVWFILYVKIEHITEEYFTDKNFLTHRTGSSKVIHNLKGFRKVSYWF